MHLQIKIICLLVNLFMPESLLRAINMKLVDYPKYTVVKCVGCARHIHTLYVDVANLLWM